MSCINTFSPFMLNGTILMTNVCMFDISPICRNCKSTMQSDKYPKFIDHSGLFLQTHTTRTGGPTFSSGHCCQSGREPERTEEKGKSQKSNGINFNKSYLFQVKQHRLQQKMIIISKVKQHQLQQKLIISSQYHKFQLKHLKSYQLFN